MLQHIRPYFVQQDQARKATCCALSDSYQVWSDWPDDTLEAQGLVWPCSTTRFLRLDVWILSNLEGWDYWVLVLLGQNDSERALVKCFSGAMEVRSQVWWWVVWSPLAWRCWCVCCTTEENPGYEAPSHQTWWSAYPARHLHNHSDYPGRAVFATASCKWFASSETPMKWRGELKHEHQSTASSNMALYCIKKVITFRISSPDKSQQVVLVVQWGECSPIVEDFMRVLVSSGICR